MNKIIAVALEAKYGKENVPALLQVVNATRNTTTATELLLGVYEEPQFAPTHAYERSVDGIATFISAKCIEDEVHFSYMKEADNTLWFKTQEDADVADAVLRTAYNKGGCRDYKTGDYTVPRKYDLPPVKETSYCSFDKWLSEKSL